MNFLLNATIAVEQFLKKFFIKKCGDIMRIYVISIAIMFFIDAGYKFRKWVDDDDIKNGGAGFISFIIGVIGICLIY